MLTLDAQIEAVLFFSGEPVSKIKLSKILNKNSNEIEEALLILGTHLEKRGLILIISDDTVSLGTSPDISGIIGVLKKDEIDKDLTKASLETLAIVLYKGPITRAQIDYIRGVSSTFILRNLHIRGLIEKVENSDDSRSYLYKTSIKLLSFLGISKIEDMPEFDEVNKEININEEKIEN
ncbi:MAG: SMC-Scp complex subunit ScpB [Candidatus Pacebacteria bacterium]|nr:SMC-Scp complex subunit ScpB [Candidatus Paceibacterota bacterium]